MENIDWSKAPEGATHCGNLSGMFYRFSGDYAGKFWSYDLREWLKSGAIKDCEPMIKRPSAAWSGEGLPPVGVRCEAAIPHTSGPDNERSFIWIEGSVIAYYEIKGKTYAWFAEDDGFYPPNVLEFRPIRTPEQIAADEREAAIRAIVYDLQDAENLSSLPSIANCLYAKGYRKP